MFELVVAGRRNDGGDIDITMVEAGATAEGLRLVAAGDRPSDEEAVAQGLEATKTHIAGIIDLQLELASQVDIAETE